MMAALPCEVTKRMIDNGEVGQDDLDVYAGNYSIAKVFDCSPQGYVSSLNHQNPTTIRQIAQYIIKERAIT